MFAQAEFEDLFEKNKWNDTYYSLLKRMIDGALRNGVFVDQSKSICEFRSDEVIKNYRDHELVPWTSGDNRLGSYARERLGWNVWHSGNPDVLWVNWGGINAATK